MATMADLDGWPSPCRGRPRRCPTTGVLLHKVGGKFFCFHRRPRPDALDRATGERLDDVLVFRLPDLDLKDLLVADDRRVFFTTPHWNGYPAVLMRIPDLARIDRDELQELLVEAWLTRAQKRVAKAWLAEHGPPDDSE